MQKSPFSVVFATKRARVAYKCAGVAQLFGDERVLRDNCIKNQHVLAVRKHSIVDYRI